MGAPDVTARPACSSDAGFLLELFTVSDDSRAWLGRIDAPLVTMQFTARQSAYAARFPDAVHEIIEVGGRPAGQVRWTTLPDAILIVDIEVLPAYRRRGAATAVYERILAQARAAGKPARATIAKGNIASLALHQRLGFAIEAETDTHYTVTSAPAPAESAPPRS